LPAAATPTFLPAPGIYTSAQSVSLADTTTGAVIHYTLNGSTPTANSAVFTPGTPIAVTSTTTINAIAVAAGYSNSADAAGTYTINLPSAATPTFSPLPGSYTTAQSISLSDLTPDAAIYYTTNGTTPSASSTLFTAGTPIAYDDQRDRNRDRVFKQCSCHRGIHISRVGFGSVGGVERE
jgi:hypothetical protein